jgi:hypothetical protein
VIVAHALGGVRDLPVPGELFLYGGAIVLGLSFLALGFLWPEPRLAEADVGRPLPGGLQRILLSPALRIVLGALSVGLFILVIVAGLVGRRSVNLNLAPTVVWVLFWLGLVPVTLLLGNVWAVLSPLRAVADAVAWLTRRVNWQPLPYPERVGRWPAAVLFFAVAAMELVYTTPADPPAVATAVIVYSIVTWTGMLFFGRRAWLENGEAFHVYFGLFALMAPFAVRRVDGRRTIVVRPPFAGLSELRAGPGHVPMVAAMLGSVGFDSITRASFWQNFQASSLTSDAVRVPVMLAVLTGVVCFVALAYHAAIRFAHSATGSSFPLAPLFLGSLVPIAFVYSIAHYISLLLSQGQFAIPLASDPLGKGWDLFGSADFSPNLVPLTPHELWYIQVGTLVAGHVVGLVAAHDRSVQLFEGAASLRSQYAMLMLMVLYTCGGLYLLSSP